MGEVIFKQLELCNHNPTYKVAAEIKITDKITTFCLNRPLRETYVGITPIIKARVVRPKEKPGLPGNILEIATKVIGMVMLNKNIPVIERKGTLLPKASKGAEIINEATAVLVHPNLSPRIPPNALPKKTAQVKITNKIQFDFQGNSTTVPMKDLAATTKKRRTIVSSKYLNLPFFPVS